MKTEGNLAIVSQVEANGSLSPEARVMELAFGALTTQALYVVAKLGIADLLSQEALSIEVLASKTEAHVRSLYRIMRSLAAVGIFEELNGKVFRLTPYGATLRSDAPKSLRNGIIFMGESWHWSVWGDMMHSAKTGQSAWKDVHGEEVFDYFQSHEKEYEIFNRAMTGMSASVAPAVIEAYDFSEFETLADIAGGQGLLLSEILKAYPMLQGILFDLPAVIESPDSQTVKQKMFGRLETVAGNFFESVPQDADGYLLKHIIHDWDDAKATQILKNIADAMKQTGKVLLVEVIVPTGNEPSFGKLMDLEMLVSPGGIERTADEYRELLSNAGLRLTRIIPTKSAYSIVEAVKR